jgi:hypothetical protein
LQPSNFARTDGNKEALLALMGRDSCHYLTSTVSLELAEHGGKSRGYFHSICLIILFCSFGHLFFVYLFLQQATMHFRRGADKIFGKQTNLKNK